MSLPLREISPDLDPAWHDIEQLVAGIDELSKALTPFREFSKELVTHTVRVLAAVGGAVWLKDAQGNLLPVYQSNLWPADSSDSYDFACHQRLTESVIRDGKPDLILPNPHAAHGEEPLNSSELLLLFSPIQMDRSVVGVIELGQRPTDSVDVHRGHLRLLAILCELAAQHLTRAELHRLRQTRLMSRQFQQFAGEIHRSLDLSETAYRIVNEGKRFVGCDRVSVLVPAGRRVRLLAISGLDTFDRRANAVRNLEHLAATVAQTNDVLRYDGNPLDLAPEIQQRLKQHLDQSHARTLIAVPMHPPASGSDAFADATASDLVGVLVAEHYDADADPTTEGRLELMVSQSAVALKNAQDYQGLPLLPILRTFRRRGRSLSGSRLPLLITVFLLLLLVAAAILVPADFHVSVSGELQPEQRRDVFAPLDAEVAELLFEQDELVRVGQELLLLKSPELELELQRVHGEYETARKRLWAVESARLQSNPDGERPPAQLAAEQEELKQRLASHQDQLLLLRDEIQKLTVRSPIDGRVLTWDIETLLKNRPVQRGQALLRVGDIDGPWLAELEVPDDRIGYVLKAQQEFESPVDVSFELATRRGQTYSGHVTRIASRTEVNEDGKATVLVTVVFDADSVADLRPGTTISAKVHCGQRSLAYVWLHDVIEVVREWIFF